VGGPSPEVSIAVEPERPKYYYRHSLWAKGGEGMPWITASGVEGAESISIGLIPGQYDRADANNVLPYTVRLYFAEPGDAKPGRRVFSVSLQGEEVVRDLDIAESAGGELRGIVKEFKGIKIGRTLTMTLTARLGEPVISGIELMLEP